MTVCTDVYVLPQDTCDTGVLFLYPSQVHPFVPPTEGGPAGGRYYLPTGEVFYPEGLPKPYKEKVLDDDEALALLLIEWARTQ